MLDYTASRCGKGEKEGFSVERGHRTAEESMSDFLSRLIGSYLLRQCSRMAFEISGEAALQAMALTRDERQVGMETLQDTSIPYGGYNGMGGVRSMFFTSLRLTRIL